MRLRFICYQLSLGLIEVQIVADLGFLRQFSRKMQNLGTQNDANEVRKSPDGTPECDLDPRNERNVNKSTDDEYSMSTAIACRPGKDLARHGTGSVDEQTKQKGAMKRIFGILRFEDGRPLRALQSRLGQRPRLPQRLEIIAKFMSGQPIPREPKSTFYDKRSPAREIWADSVESFARIKVGLQTGVFCPNGFDGRTGRAWTMHALKKGAFDIFHLLVRCGASLDIPDHGGSTPKDIILEILLVRSAPEIELDRLRSVVNVEEIRQSWNPSPVHRAVMDRDPDTLRLVLADPGNRQAVDMPDKRGRTALHHAAQMKHDELLETLLDAGVDLDARDCNEETPLHLAVQCSYESGARMLIARGASVLAANKLGQKTIHIATVFAEIASFGSLLEMLIDAQCPVDEPSIIGGSTSMQFAEMCNSPEKTEILKRYQNRG